MKPALLLLAAIGAQGLSAQGPDLQWLRTAGGFGDPLLPRSAIDATGHLYLVGHAVDPDYGSGVSMAGEGCMLARYNSSGAIDWARHITTQPGEHANIACVATTSSGHVWVAGDFTAPTLTIDGFGLTNTGSRSAFLARFDAEGTAQAAIAWGGTNGAATVLRDICTDAQDRIHVTGSTNAAVLTAGAITLPNTAGGTQLYTLAFAANGTALRGHLTASPGGAPSGHCIAVDATGRTYVVGQASGDVVIGGEPIPVMDAPMALLLRYDDSGVLEHAEALAAFRPWDITVDDAGQVYVGGDFNTTLVINGDTWNPIQYEGLIAAFPGDGTCAWAVNIAGEHESEACQSVMLNAARTKLLVGGVFAYHAWFGDVHVESGLQPFDGFIMQMGMDGAVQWVKVLTGDGPALHVQALYDTQDRIHASGCIQSTDTFIGAPVLNDQGASNTAFVARFEALPLGLADRSQPAVPALHPNPCNGSFVLELPSDARTVLIEDAQGRVVHQARTLPAQRESFHLPVSGVYLVTVLTDQGRHVQRLVVE